MKPDRIDISRGKDLAKSNSSKGYLNYHYWLLNHRYKFQDYVFNGCHDLSMFGINISNIAIITVKNVDYRCIMFNILLLNIVVIFSQFFFLFLFSIYKMADADSMNVYKSLNVSTGPVMKNPEMLINILDHLKTKTMCKHAVKKLPYLLRFVSDQYKAQEMCNKAIQENAGTLTYVPNCCRNQGMCNKALENYPHTLEFVPKPQKICDKAVDTYPSTIKFCLQTYFFQNIFLYLQMKN